MWCGVVWKQNQKQKQKNVVITAHGACPKRASFPNRVSGGVVGCTCGGVVWNQWWCRVVWSGGVAWCSGVVRRGVVVWCGVEWWCGVVMWWGAVREGSSMFGKRAKRNAFFFATCAVGASGERTHHPPNYLLPCIDFMPHSKYISVLCVCVACVLECDSL